jgi:SAM-dependent methyltransferase
MPERPEPFIEGLVPTLNHRGFMSDTMNYYSEQFAEYAGKIDTEVLDIGCAYGIASQAALKHGARVLACDMDERHLQILLQETPHEMHDRLRTSVGILPDVDFPDNSFGAIHCSRVLHFLLSAEIRESLDKMYRWLIPGGRLFLVADTPYTGFWFSTAPEYERRKADGDEWPGFIEDISPLFESGQYPEGMLPYLNPLDPDILSRECRRTGLVVEIAEFIGRDGSREGRHHAGLIAHKPGGASSE